MGDTTNHQLDQPLGYRADVILRTNPIGYNNGFCPTSAIVQQPQTQPGLPTRLKLRSRGRWVFTAALIVCIAFAVHMMWHALFRFEAAGVVAGKTVHIANVVDGLIKTLHVEPGQRVKPNQVLASLDNLALRQKRQRLNDEIAIAQAELKSKTTELLWHDAQHHNRYQESVADYHTAAARLASEQARLESLEIESQSIQRLHANHAATDHELRLIAVAISGQRKSLEQVNALVEQSKQRVALSTGMIEQGQTTLLPHTARIQRLMNERSRIDEQLASCIIRSPINGIVLSIQCQPGEFHRAGTPMMSILDTHSLYVILYLSQTRSAGLSLNEPFHVVSTTEHAQIKCRVARIGDQHLTAPPSIRRFYRLDERLLPVYLECDPLEDTQRQLRLGQTVRLPRRWF